jgi:hypothetical protein
MIDVSDILSDPDLAQPFTIKRSRGEFAAGGYTQTTTTVQSFGVIIVAQGRELEQVPEGDRVKGAIVVYSAKPLYLTHGDNQPGLSDTIIWRGDSYRLAKLYPYMDFGYYKAVGVRISGQ